MLVTFLSFSDEIPRQLSVWQYRQTAIAEAKPLQQQYEDAAAAELGSRDARGPRASTKQEIEDMADEIREINEGRLPPYIRVPRGTQLALPGRKHTRRKKTRRWAQIARQVEGSAQRAALLQTLNAEKLKPPEQLPEGAKIALPHGNLPALILFRSWPCCSWPWGPAGGCAGEGEKSPPLMPGLHQHVGWVEHGSLCTMVRCANRPKTRCSVAVGLTPCVTHHFSQRFAPRTLRFYE